jgi:hydrogenase nickel incorporation protein HypA/HybF
MKRTTLAARKERRLHELSLCQAIAESVTRHADGRPVTRVSVRVGHLRQVVPDSMLFSWEMLTSGSDLEGCVLDIEHVPATIECNRCQATTTLDMAILLCGACGDSDVTVRSGEELLVVSLELAEV